MGLQPSKPIPNFLFGNLVITQKPSVYWWWQQQQHHTNIWPIVCGHIKTAKKGKISKKGQNSKIGNSIISKISGKKIDLFEPKSSRYQISSMVLRYKQKYMVVPLPSILSNSSHVFWQGTITDTNFGAVMQKMIVTKFY